VYIADSSANFWKSVDLKLVEIRDKAGVGEDRNKCIAK
jgi:hypothetical protein